LPNPDGRLASSFGSSSRSFFRLRGRVSCFDYRDLTEERLRDTFWRCTPWQAGRHCNYAIGIYFLSSAACAVLESYRRWHEEEAYTEMVVPYVEAGHPGPIPLTAIDELLRVSIEHVPHPLELALERVRREARAGKRPRDAKHKRNAKDKGNAKGKNS
jgi:hypothetical protein